MEKVVLASRSLLERIRCALTEPVMGFFALVALALAFAPELFDFRPAVLRVFDLTEWVIVGVFAAEYAVNFVFADRRRDYFSNPWRIIDLGIIIAALASALPQINDSLRSSPVIRILRLLRIILFGARASGSIAGRIDIASITDSADTVHISILRPGEPLSRETTIDDLLSCTRDRVNDQWCHGSGIQGSPLEEIAKAAGTNVTTLKACFSETSYPRIEKLGSLMGVVLSVPWHGSGEFERHTIVALLAGHSLLTLSRKVTDIQQATVSVLSAFEASGVRFSERMLLALLKLTVSGNAAVVGELERQLRALEESPVPNNQANFFEQTFRLRKQLAAARADLWRLKGVLLALVQGRAGIDAVKENGGQLLQTLTDETEYLHETIESLREALLSIIELQLNVASFEMNKVMRILAVASVLGLVPAVVGGLFGMNIEGNPWPLTLPQVTFGVSIGMLLCLYIFFAKGWLR